MKNIFLLLIITSQINFSQTKEETIDWLNLKLETYGESLSGTYQVSIKESKDYGEYLLFTKKDWNFLTEKNVIKYYSILPKDVSKIYLSGKSRTNNSLDIYLKSNNKIYETKKKIFISEIDIQIKNGNNKIAERIQKGLLHILEKMGHKIEKQKEFFEN